MARLPASYAAGAAGHLSHHAQLVEFIYGRGFDIVADYGADPTGVTDSTAEIQACIDDAWTARVPVLAPDGTFVYSQLDCSDKPVFFLGAGERRTLFKGDGSAHGVIANHSSAKTGFYATDINFGFGSPTATYDAVQLASAELFAFTRCGFGDARYGLNLGTDARMGNVTNCIFGSSNDEGLHLGAGATANAIVGNWFDENLSRGLYINGDFNTVTANRFLDNTTANVFIDAAGDGNVIVGNTIRAGSSMATDTGIRIYGSQNRIASNLINDHTNEIVISAGTDNVVQNNTFTGASPVISDAGTTTRVRGNIGFVTENNGTATVASGSTFVVVTHSLNKTPGAKNITVVPTNDLGSAAKFWISSVGATTFRINIDIDPGATTATFAWSAVVL